MSPLQHLNMEELHTVMFLKASLSGGRETDRHSAIDRDRVRKEEREKERESKWNSMLSVICYCQPIQDSSLGEVTLQQRESAAF